MFIKSSLKYKDYPPAKIHLSEVLGRKLFDKYLDGQFAVHFNGKREASPLPVCPLYNTGITA